MIMMTYSRRIIFTMLTVGLFLSLTACTAPEKKEESNTIRMTYANWSEGVAMTYLAEVALEEHLGYDVVTQMTDVETVFQQLESGEYDVFIDAWLPETHGMYMEKYGSGLQDLGVNFEDAKTGLLVPEYSNLNKISDLKSSDLAIIIGIGEGAGIMAAADNAISTYNLPQKLQYSSENVMTEAFGDAFKRRENIVITGWVPHWVFDEYDVKFLEDPEMSFGSTEKLHTLARSGFTNEHPRASLFFERFQLSEKHLADLMNEVLDNPGNERDAAFGWMKTNPQVVNEWVRGLRPERNKTM
jgi:glycine betaine/proline transport system substrate-binding protein